MIRLSFRVTLNIFSIVLLAAISIGAAFAGEPLLCTKGKLVFEESFSSDTIDPRWSAAKGEWKIVGGALQGTELKADKHAASIRTNVEISKTCIMIFDFKFDGGKVIHCSFNGKGHICRATITPNGYTLKGEKVKKDPQDKHATVGQVQQKFEPGKWYTMQIEMAGKEFVAQVGDGPVAFGSHEKIDREKSNFGFPMAGVSSQIDNIKIWDATLNPKWAEVKAGLPVNKISPPTRPSNKVRFERMDKDKDGGISIEEFTANRDTSKLPLMKKQFARKDKDSNGVLNFEEFVPPKKPAKKK